MTTKAQKLENTVQAGKNCDIEGMARDPRMDAKCEELAGQEGTTDTKVLAAIEHFFGLYPRKAKTG